jgi:opacity protein-like surface antigen
MAVSQVAAVIALVVVAPLKARAADPSLHVDPSGAYSECSVQFAATLTQKAFHRFAREFGSVSAFKQMAPPSTLGPGGLSFDIEMLTFPVEDKSAAWNDTFVHPDAEHELGSRQSFPKFKLRLGVTDQIDVGAYYTRNPRSNYGWLGLDAKYRILRESETTPVSLAVRGAYTKTLYVDDMDMHALTADVSLERRFWRGFTPYVGLGSDAVFVRETSDAVALRRENIVAPHLFGGFDVKVWQHLALGAEFTLGALPSQQVKVAVVF